jgi:predicted pyridoxine 5'-phosphate oxidase superfamily flavin-nucleotide-binding protein
MVQGWHSGEREIHARLNYTHVNAGYFQHIEEYLPDQHRVFYHKNLPFIPLAVLDVDGRPWSSFAFAKSGEIGFITSPTETTLEMTVSPPEGDPLDDALKRWKGEGNSSQLIAGIGIDLSNRRRNKFAGHVTSVAELPTGFRVALEVNQAIGYVRFSEGKYVLKLVLGIVPSISVLENSDLQLLWKQRSLIVSIP